MKIVKRSNNVRLWSLLIGRWLLVIGHWSLLIGLLLLPACGKVGETKTITLGAYYFSLNPDKHKNTLRQKLIPPQTPVLGNYDCRNESIIQQHLTWANQAGIDFFIMHWLGQGSPSDTIIKNHFSPYLSQQKSPTKFCISYLTPYLHKTLNYETALSEDIIDIKNGPTLRGVIIKDDGETITLSFEGGERLINYKDIKSIKKNQESEVEMLLNFSYLAQTYFNHPNYFRINNRPVVFLYLSRLLKGDYAKIFGRLRAIIKQQSKEDIYLVGDEIFWTEPNQQRIAQLDAITVYNMYGRDKYAGYAGECGFLKDLDDKVLSKYQKIAEELNIGFIPNVMPGFNDRGVPEKGRLQFQERHYIIPRGFSLSNNAEGSFYRAYFKVAQKYLDPQLNLVVINSWNGWRDDTQIEPVKKSSDIPTKLPKELTGGYEYNAYGETYLNITREEKTFTTEE